MRNYSFVFIVFAVLYLHCTTHNLPMDYQAGPEQIQFIGQEVTISYLADPVIGRGQFLLDNPRPHGVSASVESLVLRTGEQRRKLSQLSLYDLDQERALDAAKIRISARSRLRFLVGFPSIPYHPNQSEPVLVELMLDIEGKSLQAVSPVRFVRRIPRR